MNKKKVAFICVHNSCRSQIAEALGKHLASDIFESYSAGTEIKPQINQDAVRIMKETYGIDMEANSQHSKLITDIPDVDIAISMGCNVGCPFIGRAFDDNWGLDDPTGKSDDDFKAVIQRIEENIMELKKRLSESGVLREKTLEKTDGKGGRSSQAGYKSQASRNRFYLHIRYCHCDGGWCWGWIKAMIGCSVMCLRRFHYVCYRCDSAVCKNATKRNNERCLTTSS